MIPFPNNHYFLGFTLPFVTITAAKLATAPATPAAAFNPFFTPCTLSLIHISFLLGDAGPQLVLFFKGFSGVFLISRLQGAGPVSYTHLPGGKAYD